MKVRLKRASSHNGIAFRIYRVVVYLAQRRRHEIRFAEEKVQKRCKRNQIVINIVLIVCPEDLPADQHPQQHLEEAPDHHPASAPTGFQAQF
jgi:hypothetical protein